MPLHVDGGSEQSDAVAQLCDPASATPPSGPASPSIPAPPSPPIEQPGSGDDPPPVSWLGEQKPAPKAFTQKGLQGSLHGTGAADGYRHQPPAHIGGPQATSQPTPGEGAQSPTVLQA